MEKINPFPGQQNNRTTIFSCVVGTKQIESDEGADKPRAFEPKNKAKNEGHTQGRTNDN